MVSIHFVIEGRVQTVGFRYFLKQKADSLNIRGYVKNTIDGKIQGVIQGSVENISRMQGFIKQGPATAHVTNYSFKEVADEEFEGFIVRV